MSQAPVEIQRRPVGFSVVYLAGPMRGYPKYNFPAFDAARDRAKALGWVVISPADLDQKAGLVDVPDDKVWTPAEIKVIIERDVKAILSLSAEMGDAIAMLPGHEKSKGATAELALARWMGLKVLDATTFQPLA